MVVMGKRYQEITPELQEFIARQHLFFVATAARVGRVNGMNTLRILGPRRAVRINLTGSNEAATHLLDSDRMTHMWRTFDGDPMTLRLYGRACSAHPRDGRWNEMSALFPPLPGARQAIEMVVDLAQMACGVGVPLYDYADDCAALNRWAEHKGVDGITRILARAQPAQPRRQTDGHNGREVRAARGIFRLHCQVKLAPAHGFPRLYARAGVSTGTGMSPCKARKSAAHASCW